MVYLPPAKKDFWQKAGDWVKASFFPSKYIADVNADNAAFQARNQHELQKLGQKFTGEIETRRERFAIEKTKLDYVVQFSRDQASREFQKELQESNQFHQSRENQLQRFFQSHENELSREAQRELTEYIQKCENLRQTNRMGFDQLMQTNRQKHEIEMQQSAQAFTSFQMFLQAQIQRNSDHYRRLLDSKPCLLEPMIIMNQYESYRNSDRPVPPFVIVSPPDVNFERFGGSPNPLLGKMANSLEEEVRVFCDKYNEPQHPVRYISKLWDTKRMAGDTAATMMHNLFGTIPTIILESETEGDFLNFRTFFWEMGEELYRSNTVLSQFSMAEFLFDIQRDRARQWEENKAKLEANGIDPLSLIKTKATHGQDNEQAINEYNLNQLKKEIEVQKVLPEHKEDYMISRESIQELKKYLRILHCLVAGLAVDDYHLARYGTIPKMPSLIRELITDLSEQEAIYLLDLLVSHYRTVAKYMSQEGSGRVAEVMVEMAVSLSKLPIAAEHAKTLLTLSLSNFLNKP